MKIDFDLTANDYAKHRAGFPNEFFKRIFDEKIVETGNSLVDIGTGTGTLARGFASRGCRVTALDPSRSLMDQAKELDKLAGVTIEYRLASAEETGLPDLYADVVTAGQCWHWFDSPKAAQEVKRILKPNGKVIIAYFDWLPLKGNIAEATEKIIQKHNPNWKMGGGLGIHPQYTRDIAEAGFVDIRTFSFDIDVPYSHEDWRGRIRASAGVGASLSPENVAKFDLELKEMLENRNQLKVQKEAGAEAVLQIQHRVFAIIAYK